MVHSPYLSWFPTLLSPLETTCSTLTAADRALRLVTLGRIKTWPPLVTGLISDILGNSAVGET